MNGRFISCLIMMAVGAPTLAACSEEPNEQPAVAVTGAPLSVVSPELTTNSAGEVVVIGTISNGSERTIEIVSATFDGGERVEFAAQFDSRLDALTIDPESELNLTVDGASLLLVGVEADTTTVEVTLELDIKDSFTFEVSRSEQ